MVGDPGVCDCIVSGNLNKPKQHQADPHAKSCSVYRRWVDLTPADRARRLAQPITIASHGGNKSWGGCNLQDHLQDQDVAPRDQWF